MLFSSPTFFALFLPIVLSLYYLLDKRFRNCFLVLASLLFYAWGESRFVLLLVFSLGINYLLSLWIGKLANSDHGKRKKLAITIAVLWNLALLYVCKYLNFTTTNIIRLTAMLGVESPVAQTSIPIPLGISFFTFQILSYHFDIYYKKIPVDKNILNFALYITFFPQMLQGPIVRYDTVAQDLTNRNATLSDFARGITRFIIGLFKKSVISNTLAVAVNAAFDALSAGKLTTGYGWLGGIAYSLQIYFDFSGYSDMAIGLGLLFGFHFQENFNFPYMSATISEFWRRWHISLGSWFRDYVYIPLGGNRVNRSRLILNLFTVWILTGIWHGANWTFVFWGMMYFVLLTAEKLISVEKKLKNRPIAAFAYRLVSLLFVMCGWVMFRATSLSEGCLFIASIFGFAPGGGWSHLTSAMWNQYLVIVILALACSGDWRQVFPQVFTNTVWMKISGKLSMVIQITVLILLALVSVSFSVASPYNPFIYFNF